jgi:hypothetical protein
MSNIEHDVHGHKLNAYKILKHLNKDQKDSADIQVINEVKWLEYFTRQWSKNDDLLEVDNKEKSTSASSSLPSIGVDRIKPSELQVLHKCKNRKHPGLNKIATEMIKYASNNIKIQFLNLLNNCWQSKYSPENWKKAKIIPIFKKEADQNENYREIRLLNEGYKIHVKIITAKLQKIIETIILEQSGFRKGR